MVKRIDIGKANKIYELKISWAAFYQALELFSKVSGQTLREGEGRVMAIYNKGLRLYNSGLKDIENLDNSLNVDEENKIIQIADNRIKEAELFKTTELRA